MSETTKRLIAAGVAVAALAVLIYGTYLPYRKSALYIQALEKSGEATSLDTFLVPFMSALSAPSPVGQEELVRNFGATVGTVVDGASAGTNPTLVRALGAVLDDYAKPVIERRSGLSQAQTYYTMTTAYRIIDGHDETKNFRERYGKMLHRGVEISPDRPQFLYGLIDFEQRYGSNDLALQYAERVKELWPSDKNIDRVIRELKD
jgi:hypothetical protein